MSSVDIASLQSWVGREHRSTDVITPFAARALAAALDHARLPEEGDPLPLAWHWLYFLDAPRGAETSPDGHRRNEAGFLPPAPLPRRMWAAGSLEPLAPLVIGRPTEKVSTIRSIELKQGKSGSLVFVTVEHAFSQGGRLCLRDIQNLVYREAITGPAPLPPGETAPTPASWRKTVTADPVLLFRYSALTYNGHRIHYDRDYAREQEFYPALVVHGPLLATLLLDFLAERMPAAPVAEFRYRAIRPTFDTAPFTVNGHVREDGEIDLWSADSDGFTGMTGRVRLAG